MTVKHGQHMSPPMLNAGEPVSYCMFAFTLKLSINMISHRIQFQLQL